MRFEFEFHDAYMTPTSTYHEYPPNFARYPGVPFLVVQYVPVATLTTTATRLALERTKRVDPIGIGIIEWTAQRAYGTWELEITSQK